MSQKAFELYLDESGKFLDKGEHTLVGGVLIPHEQKPTLSDFRRWGSEIRSRITETGVFLPRDLETGDLRHSLKNDHSPEGERQFRETEQKKWYIFDHCSENVDKDGKSISGRWAAQGWILEQFMGKVTAAGGFPVIFDNPNGIYHIDSNTTFMSVFASGIVLLYNELMRQYPEDSILLNIHAASRENITKSKEPDKYNVSPLAGKQGTLERQLYINQIENYVFLNGGSDLLELDGFKQSMQSFEILEDIEVRGKKQANPATVVCDYVCNSYRADMPKRNYIGILHAHNAVVFSVFNQKPDLSKSRIALMVQQHEWLQFLKILISRSFPEDETKEFFDRLQEDKRYNQQTCIDGLVNYLYPFVEERENMEVWADRLNLIIRECKGFQPDIYEILKANMLIYIHSLYTHMGLETETVQNDFCRCVQNIRSMEIRDHLLILFCNRQIVTETDCFEFDKAENWFEIIDSYAKNALKNSSSLMEDFFILSDTECIPAQFEQYGKALGSYIQVLARKLRTAPAEERDALNQKAHDAIDRSFGQFTRGYDISRAHQNACIYLTEEGETERAMEHLLRAVTPEDIRGFENQAEAVLQQCGRLGEKNTYVFLHYTYMMHRCFRTNDPERGGTMLKAILRGETLNMEKIGHLIAGRPYPHGVILWHLAASLAYTGISTKLAAEIFELVRGILMNQSELFRTICMAALAEMTGLGLENRLPSGTTNEWEKKAADYCGKQYPAYAEKAVHNPFAGIMDPEDPLPSASRFYLMAERTVY